MTSGFNFWMVVGAGVMCVDNVNVSGMDFSSLPGDVQMIQWREGRGEIEYTSGPALRTVFYDVTPYTALFQQFMTLLSGITLAQAQQIQTDLIALLYDSKRQLPFNYTLSAGNYNWSALDADVAAMSIETIPFIVGNTSSVGSALSGSITALEAAVNAMIDQLNAAVVTPLNAGVMNAGFFQRQDGSIDYAAGPGLANPMAAITHINAGGSGGSGGAADIPWTPIGQYAPVNLTMADMTGLMSGIAARTQSLLYLKNWKSEVIAGYTAISDVIAYDVTAGW